MPVLRVGTTEVARYASGEDMWADLAPRPYLHPVRTLAGTVLTETQPEDHLHHHGVSAAVADINGTTYWGGASYVHPDGYVLLENQGRQTGGPVEAGPGRLSQHITWFDHHGDPQVEEDRHITAAVLPDHEAWVMRWRSRLTAGRDLRIGSPATRGRTGAGYGGLFWRVAPASVTTRAAVRDGEGADVALGSRSPWLTLTQERATGPVTLLLAQPADDVLPWFVRTDGYVGAGPAVAWSQIRTVDRGDTFDLHLWAVPLDRALSTAEAEDIYQHLETSR